LEIRYQITPQCLTSATGNRDYHRSAGTKGEILSAPNLKYAVLYEAPVVAITQIHNITRTKGVKEMCVIQ